MISWALLCSLLPCGSTNLSKAHLCFWRKVDIVHLLRLPHLGAPSLEVVLCGRWCCRGRFHFVIIQKFYLFKNTYILGLSPMVTRFILNMSSNCCMLNIVTLFMNMLSFYQHHQVPSVIWCVYGSWLQLMMARIPYPSYKEMVTTNRTQVKCLKKLHLDVYKVFVCVLQISCCF